MSRLIITLFAALFLFTGCPQKVDRFSFTIGFEVAPQLPAFEINDTIWIKSEHKDMENNYNSDGGDELVPATLFDTKIKILRLGKFAGDINTVNCVNKFFQFETTGQLTPYSDCLVASFDHADKKYVLDVCLIPKDTGVFALVLQDTLEIRKVLNNTDFNRHLLNDYDAYFLRTDKETISIDERVFFFKVD